MAIVREIWPVSWFEPGLKTLGIFDNTNGEPSVAAIATKITETDWDLLIVKMGDEQAVIDSFEINDIKDMR
jgi:hypothetical protein